MFNFINKHSIKNRIYKNKNDINDEEYEYFVISIGTKTQRDQNVEDAPFSISDKTDEDGQGPEKVVDVEDEDVQEMHHNLDPEDHPEVSSVEETASEEDQSVDETEAESARNPFVEEKIPHPQRQHRECQHETESGQSGQKMLLCVSKYSLRNGFREPITYERLLLLEYLIKIDKD